MGARDYSTTAASNLSVGGISIAEGWARASVNNAYQAGMADTANLLLDQGGSVTTTGTGTAYLLSLPTAPSAYADNMAFLAKIHTAITGPATININGLGVKTFKKLVNGAAVDFSTGDIPAGHRASCIYSSSDSAVLMLNSAVTFGVHYVDDIDEMRALPSPTPGTTIYVGDQADPFVVVDDATLGTDGGTVFIPDSELSALTSEAIPVTAFLGATGANIAMEYALAHQGLDFESIEMVVTDAGETISIWQLHGHVYNPGYTERVDYPQLAHVITGTGKFRDPGAWWTEWKGAPHVPVRTGGVLLRYKYATSGLRLKRVTGSVFKLRWWPVIAVDEEAPGVQTDNSGRICWCANAAVAAGAEAVLVEKMYHYQRMVEWPDRVELRGLGPGRSGFRVMDNGQHKELLLSTSQDGAAADQSLIPINKPATRQWAYDAKFYSQATAFHQANGAKRIRISGIEFDGNIENNMRLWTTTNTTTGVSTEYAFHYANTSVHLFNTTASCAFTYGDAGFRVVPEGSILELHNVKMHGYAQPLVSNHNVQVIGTGLVELGNAIGGHWSYFADGVYENIRCFGYCVGEGLRQRKLHAQSIEFFPAPHPDIMFQMPQPPATFSGPPAYTNQYAIRTMMLFSMNDTVQAQLAAVNYAYPKLPPHRTVVEHVFVDATGLDDWPSAYTYESAIPFDILCDNIHIKSGKFRFGSFSPGVVLLSTSGNTRGLAPYRNQVYENLTLEYSSRSGIQLLQPGAIDPGFTQLNYRNITFEPRAATHIPGNPSPSGTSFLMGTWRFKDNLPAEPVLPNYSTYYDGRDFEFSGVTVDATLNGKYIDINPPDPVAPTYRLWFNYNSAGSAPAAGGMTLIQVAVAAGATTAATAAAFSAAIAGTIASPAVPSPYLTAATYGTKSVVGALSHYRDEYDGGTGGYVGGDVTHAAGVTTALRAHRRNYEPSMIGFERFMAADPTYIGLMSILEIGASRDLYFTFKDSVFGAYLASSVLFAGSGSFVTPGVVAIRDQLHLDFENTVFDLRDGIVSWSASDLMLYAGRYRNCRVRTPSVITGLSALGAGYETLVSEQSEIYTVTPTAAATTIDIQTKLFWLPKPGNLRVYPVDTQAALMWNSVGIPSIEWRKSARPVGGASVALGGSGAYYSVDEDRRAPVIRLTFPAPGLSAVSMQIGWAAAVSP